MFYQELIDIPDMIQLISIDTLFHDQL